MSFSDEYDSFEDSEYEPSFQEDDDVSTPNEDHVNPVDHNHSDLEELSTEKSTENHSESESESENLTQSHKKTTLTSLSQRIFGFRYEPSSGKKEQTAKAIFLSRRKKRTKQQDPSKRENSYSSQKRKRKSHSENTLSEYVPTWLSTRTRTASSAKRKGQDTQQSHSQTKINESIIEISSESDKEVFSLDNKNEDFELSPPSKRQRVASTLNTLLNTSPKREEHEDHHTRRLTCSPIVSSPLHIPETPPSLSKTPLSSKSEKHLETVECPSDNDNLLSTNDKGPLDESVDISELLLSSPNSISSPPSVQRKRLRSLSTMEKSPLFQMVTNPNHSKSENTDSLNEPELDHEKELPRETRDALMKLKMMGFENTSLCLQALKHHHNNIELAVNELLMTGIDNSDSLDSNNDETSTISLDNHKIKNRKTFAVISTKNGDNNNNNNNCENIERLESLPISCRTRRRKQFPEFYSLPSTIEMSCFDKSRNEKEAIQGREESSGSETNDSENRNENKSNNSIQTLEDLIQKCEEFAIKLQDRLENKNQLQNGNTNDELQRLPNPLRDSLKDYQRFGVRWLLLLHQEQVNGILADEMGLGKTVQTIAMLLLLAQNGEDNGPHLIVVPSSTLTNWANEFQRWAPTLRVQLYSGNIAERTDIQQQLLTSLKRKKNSNLIINVCEEYEDTQSKFNQSSKCPCNVLLTTYHMILQKNDRIFFRKIPFSYLILDEAHNIKNKLSQRYRFLFKLNTRHRLLLTGTPLQNNLAELWSLLYFLMPQLFVSPTLRDYKSAFSQIHNLKKQKKDNNHTLADYEAEYVQRIKKILSPFILRRLKSLVSLNLKPKIENILYCKMTATQRREYQMAYIASKTVWQNHLQRRQSNEEIVKFNKDADNTIPSDNNVRKSDSIKNCNSPSTEPSVQHQNSHFSNRNLGVIFYNILMRLRKIANHPLLIRSHYTDEKICFLAKLVKQYHSDFQNASISDIVAELKALSDYRIHCICTENPKLRQFALSQKEIIEDCGKFQILKKLLPRIHNEGHKVLIFSQMTKMLDILEEFLEHLGYEFLRLDGQTPVLERQAIIDSFNSNPNIFVFLLSTKAGGHGINLTAANIVIFYDIAFNPYVDRQAEDRCHRLGQEKQVVVYRLVTLATCEEHILKMALEKKQLNNKILDDVSCTSKSSVTEPLAKEGNASQEEYEQILQHVFDDSNHTSSLNGEEENNKNTNNHLDIEETESVCVNSNPNTQLQRQELSQTLPQSPSHPQTKQIGKPIVIELSSDDE